MVGTVSFAPGLSASARWLDLAVLDPDGPDSLAVALALP